MKKATTILAALALGAASALAGTPEPVSTGKGQPPPPPMDPCGNPISYSNIEVLYAHTSVDGPGDDADGIRVNFEYSPMNNFFVTAGVEYLDADYGNAWLVNVGIGGFIPLTNNIHLAADGGVLWSQVESDFVTTGDDTDDDTGWYIRPHLRAKWGCFTLHAGAIYRDIFDDDQWQGFVSGYYQLCPNWDVTAGYRFGENDDTITAGVRYRF